MLLLHSMDFFKQPLPNHLYSPIGRYMCHFSQNFGTSIIKTPSPLVRVITHVAKSTQVEISMIITLNLARTRVLFRISWYKGFQKAQFH